MTARATPDQLREHSLSCRRAAQAESRPERRRLLARHALALAQLAEQIEREQPVATPAILAAIERSARLLTEPFASVGDTPPGTAPSLDDEAALHRARVWRQKAQECRAVAEHMMFRETRATDHRLADDYDSMARREEERLAGASATQRSDAEPAA